MEKACRRYFLYLSYFGKNFSGIQAHRNQRSTKTVSEVLEEALHLNDVNLLQSVYVSSRTDAGVSAICNVLHFNVSEDHPEIDCLQLRAHVNALLHEGDHGMHVLQIKPVPLTAHCRYSAVGRTYIYRFATCPFPTRRFVYPLLPWEYGQYMLIRAPINENSMQDAIKMLSGEHDFTGFTNLVGLQQASSTVKNVNIELQKHGPLNTFLRPNLPVEEHYSISVHAPSFMYKMVRNLVGAILTVGYEQLRLDHLKDVLERGVHYLQKKPFDTAAPEGLYLAQVHYADEELNMTCVTKEIEAAEPRMKELYHSIKDEIRKHKKTLENSKDMKILL